MTTALSLTTQLQDTPSVKPADLIQLTHIMGGSYFVSATAWASDADSLVIYTARGKPRARHPRAVIAVAYARSTLATTLATTPAFAFAKGDAVSYRDAGRLRHKTPDTAAPPTIAEDRDAYRARPLPGQAAAIVYTSGEYLARFPLAVSSRADAWAAATAWRDKNAPAASVGYFTGRMLPIMEGPAS